MNTEPILSAGALVIFEDLKKQATPSRLLTLTYDIDQHVERLRKLARQNEMFPLDIAELLASNLRALLGQLGSFPEEHHAAILGAALYFVFDEDELPDTEGILGLDDDAAVFNHVATLIGRADLIIKM